jgi:hypothetical protein
LSQVSPCFSLCCPAVFHTVSGLPQPRLIGRARAIGILVDEQGQGSATKSVQAQALTCSAPHRQSGRQFLASHPSKADPVRSATSTKRILLCRQYVNTLCCIRFILKSTRAAFALACRILKCQAGPVRVEECDRLFSYVLMMRGDCREKSQNWGPALQSSLRASDDHHGLSGR